MAIEKLTHEDRMRLMRFLCSFAWADLEVQEAEQQLVSRLADKLELTDDDKEQVKGWLQVPPPAEEVDPMDIPREHREIFLTAMLSMMGTDDDVDTQEALSFDILRRLLGDDDVTGEFEE